MDRTIVHLNDTVDGRPLFVVQGAGEDTLVMRKVSHQVQVPMYGVQDTSKAPITRTLERLAAFYLTNIRKEQGTGPYRVGGFSFGSAVAVLIAQMLRASGETVEVLVLLDEAPTLYRKPKFREHTKRKIADGSLRDDVGPSHSSDICVISLQIMDVVGDMSTSGTLDDAEEVRAQFAEHFRLGKSGPKWVARFCKAYVAHVMMGLRASMDIDKQQRDGTFQYTAWPAECTAGQSAEWRGSAGLCGRCLADVRSGHLGRRGKGRGV